MRYGFPFGFCNSKIDPSLPRFPQPVAPCLSAWSLVVACVEQRADCLLALGLLESFGDCHFKKLLIRFRLFTFRFLVPRDVDQPALRFPDRVEQDVKRVAQFLEARVLGRDVEKGIDLAIGRCDLERLREQRLKSRSE